MAKSRSNDPPTVDPAEFAFVLQKEQMKCQWLSYCSYDKIFDHEYGCFFLVRCSGLRHVSFNVVKKAIVLTFLHFSYC